MNVTRFTYPLLPAPRIRVTCGHFSCALLVIHTFPSHASWIAAAGLGMDRTERDPGVQRG